MTELRASLLKWEQLEPARVWRDVHGLLVVQVGKRSTSHLTQPGLLLAAVIEAIEARGWRLTLVHNPWREERPKWGAWLSRYEEGDLALARRDHEADTPAEAILSAYLAALEAEAGR